MRLLAVLMLSLAIVTHHGVPSAGHAGHGATAPCAGPACLSGVPDGHGDEHGAGVAAACLAILAFAAALRLGRRPPWRLRVLVLGAARVMGRAGASRPVAHGPPRPLRPCVLQR